MSLIIYILKISSFRLWFYYLQYKDYLFLKLKKNENINLKNLF
jgi:hypothetical protein